MIFVIRFVLLILFLSIVRDKRNTFDLFVRLSFFSRSHHVNTSRPFFFLYYAIKESMITCSSINCQVGYKGDNSEVEKIKYYLVYLYQIIFQQIISVTNFFISIIIIIIIISQFHFILSNLTLYVTLLEIRFQR